MHRTSEAWSAVRTFLDRCESGAAAFLTSFGSFWLRVEVRVKARVRARCQGLGWVYTRTFTPLGTAFKPAKNVH